MKNELTPDQLDIIASEIKHPFYYVEYPENVSENWWKDGDGEWKHMSDMELDHIKACVSKIEKDIAYLERSGRNPKVINAIIPLAQQKLAELKKAFYSKATL